MEIVLTGTGSPIPDADRAGPSTLAKADCALVAGGAAECWAATKKASWATLDEPVG